MPRIKRWFPVSHDINSDIEVWQLTDRYGVTGLRAWLEILSIADRNDGELPGPWELYPRLLAARCKSTTRHLVGVCQFISRWLLVDSHGIARVANYRKYHRTPERNPLPSEPDLTRPSEPLKIKNQDDPVDNSAPKTADSRKLDPRIKEAADKIYSQNKKKFSRLVVWIRQAEKKGYALEAVVGTLNRFEPYAGEVQNWYAYLNKLVEKCHADLSMQYNLAEHERHKGEVRDASNVSWLRNVVKDFG